LNKEEFYEYCKAFSTAKDKRDFFDRYYHADATFEHPLKGIFRGKEEIVNFWMGGHRGIHEIIKERNLLIDEDRVAAELDIEWHCTEDTDYLGQRKKGEVYYADCAAFYFFENKKIKKVKLYLHEKK